MKKILLFLMVIMVTACGGSVQTPGWQNKASVYLEDYKLHFLSGKESAAEPHFMKARKELAAGNDLNLLATAYLTKYALQAACLESFDTADFAKLYRLEPDPSQLAYCHFLKGNFTAVDLKVFPARYAGVVKAALAKDAALAAREISAIDDPLSRLVACGIWVRFQSCDENIVEIATKTAAANGWRRPLWAYLEKQQTCYLERGEPGKAQAIKLRLEMLKK